MESGSNGYRDRAQFITFFWPSADSLRSPRKMEQLVANAPPQFSGPIKSASAIVRQVEPAVSAPNTDMG